MLDEREGELETLTAIYGDTLVTSSDYSGYIDVAVALQKPMRILCTIEERNEHRVSHLPSVRICYKLAEDYPNAAAPTVAVTSPWLPGEVASKLEAEASSLWEEYSRTQVMYAYISHLEEAAEFAFGVESLEVNSGTLRNLLDYDRYAKRRAFEQGTYECGVCLDPKKGTLCHQMEDCKHVFCIECLQGYYNNAIVTGNINDVKCPAFDCGDKRTRRATLVTPRELLRIPIERAAVQRFVDLKRKKKLESDRTTIWCPRQWCQGAVKGNNYPMPDMSLDDMGVVFEDDINPTHPIPEAMEDESAKETALLASRLQVCEDCGFAFCRLCSHTWHGEFLDCRVHMNKHSERTAEEEASLDFIRQNTSKCPKCDSSVQKTEACNHMICSLCQSHFCYLCSEYLDEWNPYAHFNRPGSFCNQRLWEGSNGEDVER